MALPYWAVIGVLVLNLALGATLVVAVMATMEQGVQFGAIGGIIVGTGIVYAEATLGERMLTVTVGEMKLLVIAASLGAVIGVVGTVLTVEPDL